MIERCQFQLQVLNFLLQCFTVALTVWLAHRRASADRRERKQPTDEEWAQFIAWKKFIAARELRDMDQSD